MIAAVVPAAGLGRRMGGTKKQYLQLAGEPVLLRALAPFIAHLDVTEVIVALPPEDAVEGGPDWLGQASPKIRVVAGGASRGESVWNGLCALSDEVEIVAVHDGARPLITDELLNSLIAEAREGRGAIAAIPAVDTVKEVRDGVVLRTLDRRILWQAQTPQVFPRSLIVEAYRRAREAGVQATDDAALVEQMGGEVRVVQGTRPNLKITRLQDLRVAEVILEGQESEA